MVQLGLFVSHLHHRRRWPVARPASHQIDSIWLSYPAYWSMMPNRADRPSEELAIRCPSLKRSKSDVYEDQRTFMETVTHRHSYEMYHSNIAAEPCVFRLALLCRRWTGHQSETSSQWAECLEQCYHFSGEGEARHAWDPPLENQKYPFMVFSFLCSDLFSCGVLVDGSSLSFFFSDGPVFLLFYSSLYDYSGKQGERKAFYSPGTQDMSQLHTPCEQFRRNGQQGCRNRSSGVEHFGTCERSQFPRSCLLSTQRRLLSLMLQWRTCMFWKSNCLTVWEELGWPCNFPDMK